MDTRRQEWRHYSDAVKLAAGIILAGNKQPPFPLYLLPHKSAGSLSIHETTRRHTPEDSQ